MNFKPDKLKFHAYFSTNVILRRPYLTEEKIANALIHYELKEVQENGRIRFVAYDMDSKKYLMVIVEVEDNQQIIFNAYFNRNFKGKIPV